MATALVTGATGLVGSHLVERLLERGDRVRALVRSTSRADFLGEWSVQLFCGGLADRAALRDAVQGAEVVYHCAARPPLGGSAQEFYRDNVEGTENLLDAAWEAGVERFVHVSTVDVYGYTHHDGADERTPLRPDGLYSWSKIEAERVAMRYYEKHGLPVSVVRPCLIYGPRDRHLLPSVLSLVGRKLAPLVAGGRVLLDMVYVGDVADALVLAATERVAVGQAYNITDGARRTLRGVIEAFAQAAGRRPRYVHIPYAPAYGAALLASGLSYLLRLSIPPVLRWEVVKAMGHHRHFSIAKAEQELGFRPQTSLAQGLERTLAWHGAEGLRAVPSEPMR
jgi:nucleoside-diphosphate-sugar epimerase